MAFPTGTSLEVFDVPTVSAGQSDLANGAFSSAIAFTNAENAPAVSLAITGTFGTAPNSSGILYVHARRMDAGGAGKDEPVPAANYPGARLAPLFVAPITAEQTACGDVDLSNVVDQQDYEFYVQNQTGQTLGGSWVLTITPKSEKAK